jgi:3D (Asp-Asp-Asp) domain-containing protein
VRAVPLLILIVSVAVPVSDIAGEVPSVQPPAPVVCRVVVTAYNSETAQTDDTPTVTSAQTLAREGIIAARWLPIGTRVRIPAYGDVDLVVEDRMAKKNWCKADIFFDERLKAARWGIRSTEIIVFGRRPVVCPAQPVSVKHKCPEMPS